MKKVMKRNGATAPRMRESAQAIWLAGLGALAAAGDGGTRVFKQFVHRGEAVDKAGRGLLRGEMKKLAARAEDLREDATAALNLRVRRPLDHGVTTALHRFGVPTRSEILALTKRVEALTRAVEKQRHTTRAAKPHHTRAAVA